MKADRVRTVYRIAKSSNTTTFESNVQEMLDDGWELWGTPFAVGSVLVQAMVRQEDAVSSE